MSAHHFQPTNVGAIYDDCSQLGLRSGLRLGLSHSARPGTQLDWRRGWSWSRSQDGGLQVFPEVFGGLGLLLEDRRTPRIIVSLRQPE